MSGNVIVLRQWLDQRSDRIMDRLKADFDAAVQSMTRETALRTLARLEAIAERYER